MRLKHLILALVLISTPVFFANAQSPFDAGSLTLTASPDAPTPGATVNLTITNYSIDLATSDIVWYLGNKQIDRGVGLTKISTTVGKLGSVNTFSVVINTQNGESLNKTLTLRPAVVDILWQADSYTPVLYPGKALPTTKNNVTFYANPYLYKNGVRLDPASLIYEWSLDFDKVPDKSGVGRSTFNTNIVDIVGETGLSLKVSSIDGSVAARARVTLGPVDPVLIVRSIDDLLGPSRYSLPSQINVSGPETVLRADTYFFPKSHMKSPSLSYKWTINGKAAIVDATNPAILRLRRDEGTEGAAKLAVSISDPFDSFITTSKSLLINLEASNSFQ